MVAATRVYVGCYESEVGAGDGGIHVLGLDGAGALRELSHVGEPGLAGYLVYARSTRTLYSIDQRTADGRGSAAPPSAVWSFDVDSGTGALAFRNRQRAPGASPNYLALDPAERVLICANHGWFDHVERVRETPDGGWVSEFVYDDSTVIAYPLGDNGEIDPIRDLHVRTGHGADPNSSPQAGGHAQASPHAHCVEVDPSGRWAVVCDKGTDEIVTLDIGAGLAVSAVFRMPPASGPRHIVFDRNSNRAYMTCELSTELASLAFDQETGTFRLLDLQSSIPADFGRLNEPATVDLHPGGRVVYMNNRGEDTIAWFSVDDAGRLVRQGTVPLAKSEHPGLAARDFKLAQGGRLMLVADWPANAVRIFTVDPGDGALQPSGECAVQRPAYIAVVEP